MLQILMPIPGCLTVFYLVTSIPSTGSLRGIPNGHHLKGVPLTNQVCGGEGGDGDGGVHVRKESEKRKGPNL